MGAATVAATTLLGADDRPAELVGYGPIPNRAKTEAGWTWRRRPDGVIT